MKEKSLIGLSLLAASVGVSAETSRDDFILKMTTENIELQDLSDKEIDVLVIESVSGNLNLDGSSIQLGSNPCAAQRRLREAIQRFMDGSHRGVDIGGGGNGSGGVHLNSSIRCWSTENHIAVEKKPMDPVRCARVAPSVDARPVTPPGGIPGNRCASVAPDHSVAGNIRCAIANRGSNIRCASAADRLNIRCATAQADLDFDGFNPGPLPPNFPPIGPIGPNGPAGIRCAECPEPKPELIIDLD